MRRVPFSVLIAGLCTLCLVLGGAGLRETMQGQSPAAEAGGGFGDPAVAPNFEGLPGAHGLRFGIDAMSVRHFTDHAGKPDYATVWVGKWNLDVGWRDTAAALVALREANVTPAIHFYYWGDDIQPACFSVGCNGKDVMGWHLLAEQLVQHLQADLQGAEAVVFLESEFNKHGVHDSEDLDAMLAEKAAYIRAWYPPAKIVLALGNWFPQAWPTWDRAAAAADYVGLQAMAGSTRDDAEKTRSILDLTLDGVQTARDLFGKPLFVQDVAVSSYPEPDHLGAQEEALARFAEGLPLLQAAGVEAVVYRSFLDVPDMALNNHYAEAERHWGLAWHDSGELKPAGKAWIAAIQKARAPLPDPAEMAGAAMAPGS